MCDTTISVPRGALLSRWCESGWTGGVQIDLLPELTILAVRTANSLYEITILDGAAGDVLVRGGRFFPERTAAKLNGSSCGGSILKSRGIYPGMKLEFVRQPGKIETCEVFNEVTGRTESCAGYPVIWSSLIQSVARI